MKEIRHDSAASLITQLERDVGDIAPDGLSSPWIYRGQANSEWDLTPSAWRPSAATVLAPWLGRARRIESDDEARGSSTLAGAVNEALKSRNLKGVDRSLAVSAIQYGWAERQLVRAFSDLADEVGLHLPHTNAMALPLWASIPDSAMWPDPTDPITALAQHHGIPTRLLDFTRSGLVAALFSAEHEDSESTAVAVWAVNTNLIEATEARVVTAPRASNSHLHAQQGCFLLHKEPAVHFANGGGTWPTALSANKAEGVIKHTLAVEHRTELLRLLWRRRITRGHLMPTYSEVANATRARIRLFECSEDGSE